VRAPSPSTPVAGFPAVADALAGVAVVLLAAARWFPFERIPVVQCAFKEVTGVPCLTCGMTRSWVHATHGRLGEALVQNPLGTLLCAGAAGFAALVLARRITGRPPPSLAVTGRRARAAALAVAAASAGNWLYMWWSGVA